ncbi:MAG: peptide deformylase [Planctomycetota bacterium]|jgi:peptide deformylase
MSIPPYPSEALRKESRDLKPEEFGPELKALVEDMVETMYESEGVGLAAPQIGRNIRLFVYDISPERNDPHAVVNPRIVEKDGSDTMEEGCLSVPGLRGKVRRAARVVIEGRDPEGNAVRLEAEGLAARVFQHEIDHLDAVLFCDRLSTAKRLLVRRHLKKMEEEALHTE